MATANSVWSTPVPAKFVEGDFETCPSDSYPGRITGIFDVGTHLRERTDSKTKEKKIVPTPEIVFVFELNERDSKGIPFMFARKMTWSMNEMATLYGFAKDLLRRSPAAGEVFSPAELLGIHVLVSISHTEDKSGKKDKDGNPRVYANIGTVLPLPKAFPKPDLLYEPIMWSPREGTPFPSPSWIDIPRDYGKTIKMIVAESVEAKGQSTSARVEARGEELGSMVTGGTRQPGDDDEKPPF